jgi:hypothetical protein
LKGRSEYRIPFVGLQVGIHYFNFEVGDAFFEHFEGSLVQQGKVFVDLALEKRDKAAAASPSTAASGSAP